MNFHDGSHSSSTLHCTYWPIFGFYEEPATVTLTNKDMSLWLLWPPRSSVISAGFTCSWGTYTSDMVPDKRPHSSMDYACSIRMCFYSRFHKKMDPLYKECLWVKNRFISSNMLILHLSSSTISCCWGGNDIYSCICIFSVVILDII